MPKSYPVFLQTEDSQGKVIVCLERYPDGGDKVEVTKSNLYRGGEGGIRAVNIGGMVGKKWEVIRGLPNEGGRIAIYLVKLIEEVKKEKK